MEYQSSVPVNPGPFQSVRVGMVALLATVFLGILLRLALGGFESSSLSKLNLRQVHTHLGFYGFLFPIIWQLSKDDTAWVPGQKLHFFYTVAVFISSVAFAWQGYGPVSRASSTIVLTVWIAFAIKNFYVDPPTKKSWMASVPSSIFCAAAFVFLVAASSIAGRTDLSTRFVSAFLTTLTFGVFVPIALKRLHFQVAPTGYLWVLLTVGFSIFQMNVDGMSWAFIWAPLLMGFFILRTVILNHTVKTVRRLRLNIYWLILALSLLCRGSGLLPATHAIGIAGVHFLILGPLLVSFFSFQSSRLAFLYDLCVGVMIAALLALEFFPSSYLTLQFVAASSGVGIFLVLLGSLTKVMGRQQTV